MAVLTTQPLDRTLDYKAPEGGCFLGAFVEVPLGPRKVLGVVWGPGQGGFDMSKARSVIRVLEVAPMREEMRVFLGQGGGLHADTDASDAAPWQRARRGWAIRRRCARSIGWADRRTGPDDRCAHPCAGSVAGLWRAGFHIEGTGGTGGCNLLGCQRVGETSARCGKRTARAICLFRILTRICRGKELSDDQAAAVGSLRQGVRSGDYGTTLLKGVTGSGKTEVYLEAVAEALRQGRQALVLLPEIALTAEFLTRVEARFGARPAEWHSGATMTERRRVWRMVGQGDAQLVVGARSALFLPFRDLGLVVVDEEHDTSYKQEDGVHYSARDMAVLRSARSAARGWCWPARRRRWKAGRMPRRGKYERIDLTSRFGAAVLPEMKPIDMRAEQMQPGTWISPFLRQAVRQRIEKGEQSLLFINRRGYAPVTLCRACGEQIACDHCDARMVEHRFLKRLMCHQCGETKPMPDTCPVLRGRGQAGSGRAGDRAAGRRGRGDVSRCEDRDAQFGPLSDQRVP